MIDSSGSLPEPVVSFQTPTGFSNGLRYSDRLTLTSAGPSDLALSCKQINPGFVIPGQNVNLSILLSNLGTGPAVAPWSVKLYLNINNGILDNSDRILKTIKYDSDLGNNSKIETLHEIPIPFGITINKFSIIALIEIPAQIDDYNFHNNECNFSLESRYTANANFDLSVQNVISWPSSIFLGKYLSYSWEINITGIQPGKSVYVCYRVYISKLPNFAIETVNCCGGTSGATIER